MSESAGELKAAVERKQQQFAPNQIDQAPTRDAATGRFARLESVAPRTQGVVDEQFPTDAFTQESPKDKEMMARLALSQQTGVPGYTPFGKMEMREGDLEWYQAKMAAAEAANFDRWYAHNFDLMSPAEKKRAKELNPQFYKRRKNLLKRQAKNLVKLAQLKIDGVQDKSDLLTQYLAESGRLDVGPLKNLLNPELVGGRDPQLQQARFIRGLANPFRAFGDEALPANVTTRAAQSQMFARRDVPQDTTFAGVMNQPYPSFAGSSTDQGDQQWYQKLIIGQGGRVA